MRSTDGQAGHRRHHARTCPRGDKMEECLRPTGHRQLSSPPQRSWVLGRVNTLYIVATAASACHPRSSMTSMTRCSGASSPYQGPRNVPPCGEKVLRAERLYELLPPYLPSSKYYSSIFNPKPHLFINHNPTPTIHSSFHPLITSYLTYPLIFFPSSLTFT